MLETTARSRIWMLAVMLAIAGSLRCLPVHALMAGTLPDTPAMRVDPNSATSPWTGVGSLIVNTGVYTAVVVAPRFVLTAAHVAGGQASAVQFVLNFGGDQTHVIQARAIMRYPTASFPYDDLALVELSSPVPSGVAIYPLVREPLTSAQQITLVGHGGSGNGDVGVTVNPSRTVKRVGGNVIDVVETMLDTSGRSSLFYLYDFDGPTGNGTFGGPTLGNGVETLVAGGDSGSPAFLGVAGNYRLVGINTFVVNPVPGQPNNQRFGMLGGGMLLTRPEFLSWIDTTTGYTAPGTPVDIPTLPQWALIGAMVLFSMIALRSHAARRA